MTFLKNFIADESGASAAEYALILAIVGGAITVGALALGDAVGNSMTDASQVINSKGVATAPAGDGQG